MQSPQRSLERGPGHRRFPHHDPERGEGACRAGPERALADLRLQPPENLAREEFRRGVAAAKLRQLVEIPVVERAEYLLERRERAPDVADETVGIELRAPHLHLDRERG